MCYNPSVSLNTFMVGLFAVLFAYYNEVITLYEGLFYMSFISIQLVEYFAWNNLNNKKINKIISYITLLILMIQVPLLAIAYNKNKNVNYIIILIFTIFIIAIPFRNNDISIIKSTNGHLQWNFTKRAGLITTVYLSIIFGVLLYNKQYVLLTILFATCLFSMYSYYKSNTWTSIWCWTANILSIYLVVKVFYKDFCTLEGTIL